MEKRVSFDTGFDRISSLPDPTRAHILSILPSCAAIRTSVLSSSWRALWTHMPSLDLGRSSLPALLSNENASYRHDNDADMAKKQPFYDFLDRAFESILTLEKLKLCVPCVGCEFKSRLDNWLGRALGYGLSELEFEVGIRSIVKPKYIIPDGVFKSNLMTKLTLVNCKVDESSLTDIHLPLLCNLSLAWVYVSEEGIGSFVANCPNLEDFNLDSCDVSGRLELSGLAKLKKVMINIHYDLLFAIKIEAPSLLEFTYKCHLLSEANNGSFQIELVGCSNVKYLKLFNSALDDSDLHSLLGKLPALERLELSFCDGLGCIKLSSSTLVHLELIHNQHLVQAQVNTRNLKVFRFDNDILTHFSLRGPIPRLEEATIYSRLKNEDNKSASDLVAFFAILRHCDRLTLCAGAEEDLIIPQQVRMKTQPPLSGVKNLIVTLFQPPSKHTPVYFFESLLWLAPCPQTISIVNDFTEVNKSLEMMYQRPLKPHKGCGCWESLPINCWRHSLSKVSIKNKKRPEDDTELARFFRNSRADGKIVKVGCSHEIPSQPSEI